MSQRIDTTVSPNCGPDQMWFQHDAGEGRRYQMEILTDEVNQTVSLTFYINGLVAESPGDTGELKTSEPIANLLEMWDDFVGEMEGEFITAGNVADEIFEAFDGRNDTTATHMGWWNRLKDHGGVPEWVARIKCAEFERLRPIRQ